MSQRWVSESAFRRGLYAEHHEELAFLYHQTTRLRDEGEVPLERLADFERRLVAHLDGLALGGSLAWREIGAHHDDEDAGHWYAAGLLACAQKDDKRFDGLLERARMGGPEPAARAATGLADALRHAMPSAWSGRLLAWLADVPQPLLGELAGVASFLGAGCREALERRLADGCAPSSALLRALGRCGAGGAVPWLAARAQAEGGTELGGTALAVLAELAGPQALALARQGGERFPVWHPVLALVGQRADVQLLLGRLAAQPAPETALALGLLGELSAVRPLVGALHNDAVAAAAATALQWITGADLTEVVHENDEDEDGDASYRRLQPRVPLARRSGDETLRVARDPARWTAWLGEASARFSAGTRYRFGRPYALPWLVQTVAEARHGPVYRRLAVAELAARHAAPRALDLRAATGRQRATIQLLQQWAAQQDTQRSEGWPIV